MNLCFNLMIEGIGMLKKKHLIQVTILCLLIYGCNDKISDDIRFSNAVKNVLLYIEKNDSLFSVSECKYKIVFMLDLIDFDCMPCFDDFINLCGEINSVFSKNEQSHIVALVRQSTSKVLSDYQRLLYWKEVNNINYNVMIASDSIFNYAGMNGSGLIIFNRKGEVVLLDHFPIDSENRKNIHQFLECR